MEKSVKLKISKTEKQLLAAVTAAIATLREENSTRETAVEVFKNYADAITQFDEMHTIPGSGDIVFEHPG